MANTIEIKIVATADTAGLSEVEDAIGGIQDVADGLTDVSGDIGDVAAELEDAADIIQEMPDNLGDVVDELDNVTGGIGDVAGATDQLGASGSAGWNIKSLKEDFRTLQPVIKVAKAAIDIFSDGIDDMAKKGDAGAIRVQSAFGRIEEGIAGVRNRIVGALLPAIENIGTDLAEALEAPDFGTLWGKLEDLTLHLNPATSGTAEAIDALKEGFNEGRTVGMGFATAVSGAMDGLVIAQENAALAADAHAVALAAEALNAAESDLKIQGLILTLDSMTLSTYDATINAEMMGQKVDEAMQKAIDKGPLTLTELNNLATGLFNDTQRAIELGLALPISTLDTMGESIDDVTGYLAKMDLPPDVKAALMAYLAEATRNLNALRDAANNASDAIAAIPATPSPGGAGVGAPIAFQQGGLVPGPIGAPQSAIVHGGEIVVNPYEPGGMRALNYAPTYNFSGGADSGTVQALQRRELMEAAVFSGS